MGPGVACFGAGYAVRAQPTPRDIVFRRMHIGPPMAQDFGSVGHVRDRRTTDRISRSRAGSTEPKDQPAVGQYAFVEALVLGSNGTGR